MKKSCGRARRAFLVCMKRGEKMKEDVKKILAVGDGQRKRLSSYADILATSKKSSGKSRLSSYVARISKAVKNKGSCGQKEC